MKKQYLNISALLILLNVSGISLAMASRSTQAIRPVVQRGANRGFVSMTTPELIELPAYKNMSKIAYNAAAQNFEESKALGSQASAFDTLKDNPFAQVMLKKEELQFDLARKELDQRKLEFDRANLQKFIQEAEILKKDIIRKNEVLKNNEGMRIPHKVNTDIVLPLRSERIKGYKNAQILEDMQNKKQAYDEGVKSQYYKMTPSGSYTSQLYGKSGLSDMSNLRDKNLDVEVFALGASIDTAKNLLKEIEEDQANIAADNKKIAEAKAALKHAIENPMFRNAGGAFQLKGLPSANQPSKGSNEITVKASNDSFDPRVDELD